MHPINKKDRFRRGIDKAKKRIHQTPDGVDNPHHHKLRDTAKICSCSMCCNPRRHVILTMQERKLEALAAGGSEVVESGEGLGSRQNNE